MYIGLYALRLSNAPYTEPDNGVPQQLLGHIAGIMIDDVMCPLENFFGLTPPVVYPEIVSSL